MIASSPVVSWVGALGWSFGLPFGLLSSLGGGDGDPRDTAPGPKRNLVPVRVPGERPLCPCRVENHPVILAQELRNPRYYGDARAYEQHRHTG